VRNGREDLVFCLWADLGDDLVKSVLRRKEDALFAQPILCFFEQDSRIIARPCPSQQILGQVRIVLLMGIGTQFEIATNLHQVLVARLWSPGAILGEDLWMDIELHGNELDDALRGKIHFGKRTKKQAKEEQIEREAQPVGCTAAGMHLSHILHSEEEKPSEVLR